MSRHAKLLLISMATLTASMCAADADARTASATGERFPGLQRDTLALGRDGTAAAWSVPGGERAVVQRIALDAAAGSAGADWEVRIVVVAAEGEITLARLGPQVTELVVPRPLGYLVRAGEEIRVERSGGASGLPKGVIIEYEAGSGTSRLGVLPAAMSAVAGDVWTAPISGRILAFADVPTTATGLVLVDATSGAVIWRDNRAAGGPSFSGGANLVRAGIMVEAGRSYLLRVDGAAAPLQALILPARPATLALH